MNSIMRKREIMRELKKNGSVSVTELSEKLNVSSMTIRRDLIKFQEDGLVMMEHGGAVLNGGSLFEFNMFMKQSEYEEEKRRIAKKCLEYISDGDSIFLDAGTTTNEIAKLLIDRDNLLVMTNSFLAANTLVNASGIKLLMCPGIFREKSMAVMGQITDEFISDFKIDKLFLAVEGVDVNRGVSVPDVMDGATKKNLVNYSDKIICVADNSKFGLSMFYTICDLSDIDVLITDDQLDEEVINKYIQYGVNIEVV